LGEKVKMKMDAHSGSKDFFARAKYPTARGAVQGIIRHKPIKSQNQANANKVILELRDLNGG
jgi:hypothetical protein